MVEPSSSSFGAAEVSRFDCLERSKSSARCNRAAGEVLYAGRVPQDCKESDRAPSGTAGSGADGAPVFQALGNETRLKIIGLFAVRELCVCDIVVALGAAASSLAYHLRILEEASVIMRRQEGKFTFYSLNVEVLRKHRVFE